MTWSNASSLFHIFVRVEKYRPVNLDDVVSHKDIISTSEPYVYQSLSMRPMIRPTVEKFIEKNRLPHLLFYGPPGTGKTSTILAVARRIYGSDYRKQILEVSTSLLPRFDLLNHSRSAECI